jgi:hypothetical protein
MTKRLTTLVCAFALAALACGQKRDADVRPSPTPPQAAAQPTPSATCRLLSAADIREAQGEEPAGAQASEHLAEGVASSQCFYTLPTFEKSVGLEVMRAAPGAPAGALKDYWRRRFGPEALKERERERERRERAERRREEELERERKSGQVREGGHAEEEEGDEEGVPRRVAGVGDEAFWAGGEKNAALYVLTKDAVVRVNVGAPGDPDEKKKGKAAELARKVLKQL